MVKEIIFRRDIYKILYRIAFWHFRYCMPKSPVYPLACGFYITSKCNFRCEFCNIWRINPSFIVSFEKLRNLIKEMGQMKVVYFSFTGGEPLLVPYLFDLMLYAKENGIIYTHIVSNGYLMNENMAKKMQKSCVSEISFSIDGDEQFHDRKRGVKGAFRKVVEAVKYARKYSPNTQIVLNTILDPNEPENATFAVRKAEELRVKIKVQPVNNHPSFGLSVCAEPQKALFNHEQKRKLLNAINFIQGSKSFANSKLFLENYKAYLFSPDNLLFAKDNCIFGYHHVEFFNNKIFPCLEGLDWENGIDISEGSIEQILNSKLYRDNLNVLKKCQNCKRNYYVCYYEPRLNYPIWNFVKSRLATLKHTVV